MKQRKVIVTLELLTSAKIAELKDKDTYNFDTTEEAETQIQQIQVQVVNPGK